MTTKIALCASVAALSLFAGSGLAAAQTTPTPPVNDPALSTAPTAGDASTLQEVVVTATKRRTRLQDTPIAVTAISGAQLLSQHVSTIADVVHLVPSFQATTQGDHGVITLTLRGVGNDAAKTEYADPEVALFIDGLYSPRAEGASSLLFDLENIEVLRGPQGTLWGRNSTVGAVNMQTAKPSLTAGVSGDLQAGGGDYGRFGARGAINVPVSDTLALRFAYAKEEHDGYVSNQTPNLPIVTQQRASYNAAVAGGATLPAFQAINPNDYDTTGAKYNAQDQSAIRASALWKPNEKFTWNLSLEYFMDRGTPNANLLQNPRTGTSQYSGLFDTAPYAHRDSQAVRSRMDYQINDYLAVDYVAGWSFFRGKSDFDQDGGTHVPTYFADPKATYQDDRTDYSRYETYSHEVELKSSGKHTVDWILGLYYEAENNKIRFDIPIFNGTQQGTVSWQGSFIQPKETVESKAVFGQATWNVGERLHITGGLRYTDDNRTNVGGTNNGWTYDANQAQVPLTGGENPTQVGLSTYQHNDGKYSNSKLTYLARADAEISRNFLVYASISSGYKSGGLQDGGLPYGPETLTNYEVGTKNTLFNGRVTFNNALFYEDFKGYQFAAPVTFSDGSHGLAFSNAGGDTTVYGFESETTAKITPDDKVQFALSTLHTELGTLNAAGSNDYSNLPVCLTDPRISNCVNATGNALPHSPALSLQLIYEHVFHLPTGATLAPRVSTHFETESWLSILHDGSGDKQGAYTRTDLNLVYRPAGARSYEVELFVQNLEDNAIKTNAAATSDNIYTSQYLPPRTYGFNVRYSF